MLGSRRGREVIIIPFVFPWEQKEGPARTYSSTLGREGENMISVSSDLWMDAKLSVLARCLRGRASLVFIMLLYTMVTKAH